MSLELESLPLEKLPEHWKDDSRINVLFGPFRSRQVNVKDFDTKLDFWKKSIQVYCSHTKRYSFKLKDLQIFFKHNGRTPSCLSQVLEELQKTRTILPKDDFAQLLISEENLSWTSWATNLLVKKPFKWSLDKVRSNVIGAANVEDVEFVHLDAMRNDSKELLAKLEEKYKDRVINVKELYTVEGDVSLLLQYLQIQKDVYVKVVKTKSGDSIKLLKFQVNHQEGISDLDVDVYMLSETAKVLRDQLENLEEEMHRLVKDIKKHLKKGHKQLAKTILRKKHDVDKRVESKANALYNVETLQSRLEDSKHNKEVLETYKSALKGLRANFKEGVNDDTVMDTMLQLSETLDIHNDIQTSLAQSLSDENDTDLEAELEALMAEGDDQEEQHNEDDDNAGSPRMKELEKDLEMLKLPDVPTEEPSITDTQLLS